MQNYAWQLCMITGLPHTLEKSNKLFHDLPICPLTSSTIMCLGYIAPLLLTHLGTLKNKCNNNLMYVNMEREREREIQNPLDTSIGDKMSLGFEPMRGLFDFDGILIECTLTTKKRERDGIMPLSWVIQQPNDLATKQKGKLNCWLIGHVWFVNLKSILQLLLLHCCCCCYGVVERNIL